MQPLSARAQPLSIRLFRRQRRMSSSLPFSAALRFGRLPPTYRRQGLSALAMPPISISVSCIRRLKQEPISCLLQCRSAQSALICKPESRSSLKLPCRKGSPFQRRRQSLKTGTSYPLRSFLLRQRMPTCCTATELPPLRLKASCSPTRIFSHIMRRPSGWLRRY